MIVALLDVDPGGVSTLTSATITDGGWACSSEMTQLPNYSEGFCIQE